MQVTGKAVKGPKIPVTEWTERVILRDQAGGHDLPAWLDEAYATFREQVIDPAFPCFFGTQAERRGEMFYSYVEGGDLAHLPATMARFVELSALRQNEKNNFAIFFEPDETPLTHAGYRALFWRVLQHLHDHDPAIDPTAPQHDPDHPDWEFAFAGVQMFVVGCTPSYLRRRSRNLGRGMIFLFQPRSVFVDLVTQKAIGPEARGEVRRRLLLWDDGVGAHVDLGVYGDTENREWKQYFLPDDDDPVAGICPFLPRRQAPATDLVALLRRRAAEQPDRIAIRFLVDGETEEAAVDYATLDRRVRLFARQLLRKAAPGDRVMLLLPSGIDYAVAFFACLYAGMIAVPAYPADTVNPQHLARLQAMLRDAGPRLLVTDAGHAGLHDSFGEGAATVVMGQPSDDETAWQPLPVPPDAIAFLQYTSGSTATPKGVMVGHRHLMANLSVLRSGFGLRPDDVMVSWLPLYHDMGLIAGMLSPIFCGFPLVLMSPQHFLGSPSRWLRAMSRYGGTVGGAPDFAFQLCLDRVGDSQLADVRLDRWRMAWCGAEPIRQATMEGFAERFAGVGFARDALYPCYGLAEATLMVSGNRRGDGPLSVRFSAAALAGGRAVADPDGAALMDCGVAHDGHAIRIVDPATGEPCADGIVGEIRYAGPSVAGGYWQRAEDESFAGDELRTGDLGFIHQGKLFVCGRCKDLIIIRGQNLYPQDVEQTVSAEVDGLRQGRISAFLVEIDGVEGIGIAAEMPRSRLRQLDAPAMFRAIGGAVARVHQEPVALILLLNPGDLPRTSSGKLQRSACLPRWRAGVLQPAAVYRQGEAAERVGPRDAREAAIAAIWRTVFDGRDVGVTDDFFAMGGQSIAAARLAARLSDHYGVAVPLRMVFEAPTVAAQAQRLEAETLTPQQPIARRAEGMVRLPLSPAQERLWFLWRLAPEDTAYVIAGAVRLTGRLDVARLRRALAGVVARHEVLRTRFVEQDGKAWQVISDAADYGWSEAADLAVRPFDLERGPMLRAALSTVGADEHELLLSMHHIVSDGWSIPILLREVSALYAGGDLAPLPIQYGDYALAQRGLLAARQDAQLAYWRNRLGSEHPELPLPTRAGLGQGQGARWTARLAPALAARLRLTAREQGATLFMTLLAGFAVLLHRYSGQRDIRIAVPSAGRQRVETEGLIGFFVNTLVLRADLAGGRAFADLLAQLRLRLLEAQANQDLPFERLVAELNPDRGTGNPLARVKFLLQEDWQAIEHLGDLAARPIELPPGLVRFDLALDITASGHGLDCCFTYDAGLFAAEAVAELAACYVALLEAVAGDAARPVAALPLADDVAAPVRIFDGDLLSRLAARGDGIALMHQGEALDWPGLWQWSGRLAGRLCALGVKAEMLVAVALPRGPALVASVLAIWRAGGVYLPLDPALPGDRLAWQVADSGTRLVIAEAWPEWHDGAWVRPDQAGEPPALRAPLAGQAAYVIYTSGSTGRPKGVVVSHGALSAYVQAVLERLPQGIASAAYVSTPAADLGHTVLFGALWAGWTLHLIDGATAFDPDRFADYMRDHRVDALKIVPGHLGGLMQARNPADVLPQRCLILGGEATSAALAARIAGLKPGCRLVNHYGPTETTVGVLTREGHGTAGPNLPLGRPLAHARVVVVDGDGNRLPAGMAGEICIGGGGVARGYLGRPGLTAERFLPDSDGARLYRTGDRGRVLADGEIEFLGRLDDQVKIRGYRVEPEEAASRLRALPGVREAAVVARAEPDGRMRLIGYATGDGLEAETLRGRLAAVLPDYLVPSVIVLLDRLPLTANGKIDRDALPEPAVVARELVAPRNEREAELLTIWRKVLKRQDIGVTENFFALGGDSILSLQVVAQARRAGLKLTPKQVFDRPDIEGLAALAGTVVAKPAAAALPAVDRSALGLDDPDIVDVYPATGLQQGLIYHSLMRPADGVYVNQLRLTLRGPVDEAALRAAWTAAVARHDILRTGFDWRHGGAALQVVRRAVALPWTSLDWSMSTGYDADLAAWRAADVGRGFDLAAPPLMRLALFRRPDGDADLIWTNHHAITDGWSSAQLLAEIAQDTAEPAPSYRSYVAWVQAQPSGEAWWRAQAARVADPIGLALASPRRPIPGMQRRSYPLDGNALEAAARRRAVTVNTLVQGAWALCLARHAGRRQVAFGITVAGRPADLPGSERMLGLFINSLPLWVDVAGGARLEAWLRDLQAHNVALRQHEHTPLSDLQRWTGRSGDALFDSLVVFQNFPLPPDLFDKAGLRAVEIGVRTHYPLTLTVTPGAAARLDLAWDGERFDATDIERLGPLYLDLLRQLTEQADPYLRDIVLPAEPVAQPATYIFDGVPARFWREAAVRPLAEAVACGAERLSHGALDVWSNRIGRRLKRLGVGSEERVGLCLERSVGLVAGLLGILKAGGAYVPLDPAYPAARLQFMIEDAGVRRIVVDASTADRFPGHEVIRIDGVEAESAAGWTEAIHPDQLAYVIYTSGSTGQPKGVAISHGSLSLHMNDFIGSYGITADDVVLQLATISFDVGTEQVLPPLLTGARVVMRGPELLEAGALNRLLIDERVSVAGFATAYWQQWLHDLPASLPSLRLVMVGGEALPGDALRRWQAGPLSAVRLDNLYGPTETTVTACLHPTGPEDADSLFVSIGRGFPGRSLVIVDGDGNPSPMGELCIGGASVGRGYLGRPGLTAERFVPDPFGTGGRLYRTGDLCRRRTDGTIEFLGRLDHQVKLRGHRIELGEVEAALRACGGVTAAAAAIKGEGENRRLVGYAVGTADAEALKSALATRLPDYLVPSVVVMLDALPLLPNGKTDAAALPEPAAAARALVLPRDDREAALLTVWRGVLKREDIGVTENFFALGGDSILSLQVVARARQAGLRLTPKQLFEEPTIAALAALAGEVVSEVVEDAAGDIPLTPIQAWFFERFPEGENHWNQAVLLQARDLDTDRLARGLGQLVARHDALRLRFTRQADGWHQAVAAPHPVQIETATPDELQRRLDITNGPLIRAGYDGDRLLLVIHHLAVDGVSWRVLLDELQQLYAGGDLPPAGTSWANWARRLQAYEPPDECGWWGEHLAQAHGLPGLKTGDRALSSSRALTWNLDETATARLLAAAPRAYRLGVDELLLSALVQAAGHGLLVEVEGHGREDLFNDVDLSRTVGWFTTSYPVWLPDGSPVAVKETLRAVPAKGLHWGLLRQRDLPQADIGFNYLGRFEQADGPFALSEGSVGESQSGDLVHALQINAAIVSGCLSLTWRYSPEVIEPSRVEELLGRFGQRLEALVEHCLTATPKPTASDYPLAGLTQDQVEALNLGDIQDIYPATGLQQGLLYHSLLDPNGGVYVNQLRLTLKGPVDAAALKAAWAQAVARHDILRTAFEWRHGGAALQVVRHAVDLPWYEPDEDIVAWCEADIVRGFDLSRAPLFRLALFRRLDGNCDLVVTNHHAITDGWSSAQLLAEVARGYRGAAAEAPVPYRAYVAWARHQPSGEDWWRQPAEDTAGLMASLGRPAMIEPGAHRLEQHLPELGERLRQAARRRSVTLNTLMQGAWALVLARLAGQARVGFGITVSGRPAALAGVERMQGPFINSLPLWVDVPAARSLDGWLRDLQARNIAMRQYEHVSLSDLQRWTGRSGDALFDSLLVFENYPVDAAIDTVRDLLGVVSVDSRYRTHYPLSVVIEPAQGLAIRWTWDGTRLDRAAVECLSAHYRAVLDLMTVADDPALGTIALTAPAAAMAAPCAFQPVLARIAAMPATAAAVTADGATLTYGGLAAWSNRIGRRLKRLGVGPETRVGLCLDRSAGLVAAIIGVLKAGGAYVPLDPGHPAERLAATVADAGVRVMVTDRATLAAFPGLFGGLAVVLIDDVGVESAEGWEQAVRPDQLAYVIYTSGSTGRPKGVGVTHGNLARLLTATESWFRFAAADVWTLFHSYAFDFSVWEIFGCLCHGGRLVVVPQAVARDPDAFRALLRREGVTVLNQTPSAFLPLLQGDLADSLRLVIFGGEKLEPASLHRWLQQRGAAAPRLVNMYGITETTVHVTARPIALADTGGDAPRSVIGTAIPDLTLHLLDAHGNPVPVGGVGELHVGGAGLARGYLGRPGLTAERFVPDPFGPPGARLYRSGDLGRRLADGDVDYLGRNDAQVKIRGHRIELGEIQAALAAHPAVREAAVLAAEDGIGGRRLIAYVVADGIGPDDLRGHLGQHLPAYMMPAGFVFLDALPLTVNGKLDRQALPAPASEAGYAAPQTPTETMVCDLWSGLLGCGRVGRADDFFALGGHSLLAVRVAARLSDALGRKVELRLLFDHPTVAALAAALDRDEAAGDDATPQMNEWLDALAG